MLVETPDQWSLQPLERRVFLSTSIPINPTTWTFMGPAPLDWGATSFGFCAGRVLDIAPHPTDASTWYVATAGGGVWKTTNGGSAWTPLTDQQDVNFIGSVAVARSSPNVIYAGTGEATWGPSKTVIFRDNIYYGRGVLKSTDAGSTWTLLGQTEFFRRAIGKIIVHPTDPNTVYAAVGETPSNGLPGNTGIWKSVNGGLNWTNTTTSISTTAAFSDLVMDPSNPSILYAGVGDPRGNAANGLYKTTNGGVSWAPVTTYPNQNDLRLGRVTLALAPSNGQVLYAWTGASGQGGTTQGNDFQFLRSPDGGATWAARANPNVGVSLDYNMALAVDPANVDTVYVAGKGLGGPQASSMKKSSNGATSWSNIGIGATEAPHADHHALVFDAASRLIDGNDGGVWRLTNPTVGSIEWANHNVGLGTAQFVGIALNPANADIAFGGLQDNGTVKFQDNLLWPLLRGGDGGVARVDPNNPNTVYHSFQYVGSGFIERSDNGGTSWAPKTTGINTAVDSAYFYPPYVIDAGQTTRLLAGTQRVYETTNRGDAWAPISTPNANGWVGNAQVYAVAAAKSDANVVYASVDGTTTALFATTNRGATWQLRSPPTTNRISDIQVDPTDAMTVYAVVGRFDSSGHVWRTTNGGLNWTNITGNLPDVPYYSLELDVRGVGTADDVIWVGGDDGLFVSDSLGATWTRPATGLPRVQAKDIEYQKNLGILAVGTHGRGMWQLSVPDVTPPAVASSQFAFATAPHRLRFRFSEDVFNTLSLSDITVQNLTTGTTVPSASINLAYDRRLDRAELTFPGFAQGVLPDGRYRATVSAATVLDGAGNPMAGSHTFEFTFLRGDANGDARVNLDDFNILAANFGQSQRDFTQGDFDYSGNVNLDDFNLLASRFGQVVAPAGARADLFGTSQSDNAEDDRTAGALLA